LRGHQVTALATVGLTPTYRKVYRAKINNRFGMSVVQPADRQAEEMERQERQFQAAMAELE